jgi:plastocyanin
MRDRLLHPVATILLMTALVACGGDPASTGSSGASTTTGADGTVTETDGSVVITVTGLSFPAEVTVLSGKTVTWVNESSAPHEVQIDTHDGSAVDMEPIQLGTDQEGMVTLEPGTWTYFCTIHPSMTGTLLVQP